MRIFGKVSNIIQVNYKQTKNEAEKLFGGHGVVVHNKHTLRRILTQWRIISAIILICLCYEERCHLLSLL